MLWCVIGMRFGDLSRVRVNNGRRYDCVSHCLARLTYVCSARCVQVMQLHDAPLQACGRTCRGAIWWAVNLAWEIWRFKLAAKVYVIIRVDFFLR